MSDRGPKPMSADEKADQWFASYLARHERNLQKADYRRKWTDKLTPEQRAAKLLRRKELYRQRALARWERADARRKVDRMAYWRIAVNLLKQRDGSTCGICGMVIPNGQFSLDHITPLSWGGNDDATNVRLAHLTCNVRRPRGPQAPADGAVSMRKD